MIVVFAAIAFAAAIYFWFPASQKQRLLADPPRVLSEKVSHLGPWLPVLIANLCAVLISVQLVTWTLIGSMIWLVTQWMISREMKRRTASQVTKDVVHACNLLAGHLRVGAIPARALNAAAEHSVLLKPVAITQEVGGDVAGALRRLAEKPGAEVLTELASAWQLCESTGASMGPAVLQVVDNLRSARAANRTINQELASARATGRLFVFLPGLGIAFGFVAGGNPIVFLTGTMIGKICLSFAVGLACIGLVWIEKLADSVERQAKR